MTAGTVSPARPTLRFIHGWAFDAAFWNPLRAALADWPQAACDAGYFGRAHEPDVTGPVIAVGHSLGVLRLLRQLPDQCIGLVSINGFPRFSAAPDFPSGVPARLLDRMDKRLVDSPAAVVQDFRQRCGDETPFGPPQVATLRRDLAALRDENQRPALAALPAPLLALAGGADAIVPTAMTRAAFACRPEDELHWREQGGHLLPVTDTGWCAAHIRGFAARLAQCT